MKKSVLIIISSLLAVMAVGCGEKSYNDGNYTAQSSEYINDEEDSTAGNGYGVVEISISGGKISGCTFQTYEIGGKLKDEEYGKENGEIANRDFYNKAQKARAACDKYAQQLVSKGDIKEVDAISGATVNYNEFVEAVNLALKDAEAK
ncbi:MAG: FMN-binding protein [Ruminococcus sp.]|nr:FMN-binding protein [Ruminococcus sp.]